MNSHQTTNASTQDLAAAYHRELAVSARSSALIAAVLILVIFPGWFVFDLLVLPDQAMRFTTVRLAFEVPIAAVSLALLSPRIGRRWPQATAFALMLLPEIAIAWMVPRSEPALEPYLLGFSLTIFGSAVLLVWRWQLTALLVGATLAFTAFFCATASPQLDRAGLATTGFFLGTAGIVAVFGQFYRYRAGWQQFLTNSALEREHARNEMLLRELDRLSREDSLTGAANRRSWDAWIATEIERSRRTGQPLSILLCDLDHFKRVNDQYGHAAGDEVLVIATEGLHARVRISDLVARLGGDEFVVGCPATNAEQATALAEDLARATADTAWPRGVAISWSFGVAELQPSEAVLELMLRADQALYRAKSTGRRVCVAEASAPLAS